MSVVTMTTIMQCSAPSGSWRAGKNVCWREVDWVKEALDEPRWMQEIRENLRDRVTYQIHLRTPQASGLSHTAAEITRAANKASWVISPEAYADPVNRAILEAAAGGEADPGYHSDWYPYGGYSLIREGWGPRAGYAAMFASPRPGAYGGYRSRSNNNVLCLASDAQDLLIDDTVGHYMYPSSPIRVDGMNQNFHAGEGIYKVEGARATSPTWSAHGLIRPVAMAFVRPV